MRLSRSGWILLAWVAATVLVALGGGTRPARASDGKRTAQEKIAQTDWAGVRGANFIPSYAANTYEIWRNYDHAVFDRELRLVRVVGYNSVRLWLNYAAFEELGSEMVDRVEDALRLCAKYHLRAVVNLFDGCGVHPRKDERWMTASEAYDYFMNSSRFSAEEKQLLQHHFGKYCKGFGKDTLVPVGADSPIIAIVFQHWQSTPGSDRLGPEWYPNLEAYVDALLSRLKDNPNVLLWDLMNEPQWSPENFPQFAPPEMKSMWETFLAHFHNYLKQRFPNEIMSIGWAGGLRDCQQYAHLSDVLTFHIYGGPERIQSHISEAWALSQKVGKPIFITETLANWDFGSPDFGALASDAEQLAHYQRVLPVLMKSPIGWMAWGMVISRDFDPYTDIFYPDGHPRPAAVYLEKMLKGSQPPKQ